MKKTNLPNGIKIAPISLVDLMEIQSSIQQEYIDNKEPINPPTYFVEVGDDKQEHEHFHEVDSDGKVVRSTLETDEDHEAWQAYETAITKMNAEIASTVLQYMFVEGVQVDWKKFSGWEEKKKKYKIRIPEDEDEKKIYFLTSVVFPTPADQKLLYQEIMLASAKGSDPEKIRAIEALFPD